MAMIKLKAGVFVNPDDISSIQHEELWRNVGSITDYVSKKYFDGSIVTLKCGRKISIADIKPEEIFKKLENGGENETKG